MNDINKDLHRIDPKDVAAWIDLAGRLAKPKYRDLWGLDPEAAANPVLWFQQAYCHPNSMVFIALDGAYMYAFLKTIPTWRAATYLALLDPKKALASRGKEVGVFKQAAQIMMLTHELHVLDGFISESNTKSRRRAEQVGFKYRGRIKPSLWYTNMEIEDRAWYTLDRAAVGLD